MKIQHTNHRWYERANAFILAAALFTTGVTVAHAQHEQHGGQHGGHNQTQQTGGQSQTQQANPQPSPTPASTTGQTSVEMQHDHTGHTPATAPKKNENAAPVVPASTGHDAHTGHTGGASAASPTTGEVDVNSLMVMNGDDMGIRLGRSQSNILPMGQMGSGTAWQPASSPMYMWHKRAGEWFVMFHSEAKIGVNHQGGPRGRTTFESQNWFMPMAFRRVGSGTLQLRGMFSLEPLTFPKPGSPQLFQAGEVYQGRPIIDAQHPHDLFMELSASYTVPLGERGSWFTYVGFPGEPALGPVAFMHRTSASENPTAPLGHHLQDSTHISFGVFTTGFTYRWLKLEGSLFNGREPDEHRYGFEFNPWNSRSVRVSVAPNRNWALQWSYGLLKDPELLEPGDTHRQTASIQYNRPFNRGNFATALIWGRNREEHHDETFRLNSYAAEATLNFLDKNYVYTRLELVDRKELLTHDELHDLGFGEDFHPQFRIGAYTFGAARDVWNTDKLSVALGSDVTFYSKPEILDALYGRNPTSFKFFVRLRPGKMTANSHGGHTGHGN